MRVGSIPLEVERRFSDPVRLESGCGPEMKKKRLFDDKQVLMVLVISAAVPMA